MELICYISLVAVLAFSLTTAWLYIRKTRIEYRRLALRDAYMIRTSYDWYHAKHAVMMWEIKHDGQIPISSADRRQYEDLVLISAGSYMLYCEAHRYRFDPEIMNELMDKVANGKI